MTHQKYEFHFSDKCNELHAEAQEIIQSGDICSEVIMDWLADLETARKNFYNSLPWWYKIRYSNLYMTDSATYKDALKEYKKNIYNRL